VQIVAEPVIKHGRESAPEVRDALGCATMINRGRCNETDVMPPATHKKTVSGLDLIEDPGEGAACLGRRYTPRALSFV